MGSLNVVCCYILFCLAIFYRRSIIEQVNSSILEGKLLPIVYHYTLLFYYYTWANDYSRFICWID